MIRTIQDEIRDFEADLGLPKNFYSNLLHEDDWSFVVKLNAMFEGACTHVLTVRLHAPELSGAFAQLDFANTKFGKVALLCSLNAITKEQAAVLQSLAQLRNSLVHNVAKISFSFTSYVAALDSNQLKKLIKEFGYGINDTIEIANKCVPKAQVVRENPKLSLWVTAAEILACLYLERKVAVLHLQELAFAELQKLIAPLPTTN